MHKALLALAGVMLTAPVWAEDKAKDEEKKDPLIISAELGAIFTSGNTKGSTIKGKIDIQHELESWRNQYLFDSLYKTDETTTTLVDADGNTREETDTETTAERYLASAQANYLLDNEHDSLFGYASYEKDRFSGIDYRATLAAGWGHRYIPSDSSTLDFAVGPGVKREKQSESKETSNDWIIRLSADYQWEISDNARFRQTISSDFAPDSEDNSFTRAETSLQTNINGSLAMKISFLVKHNSEPEEGKKSTDTETAITLVYTF